MWSWFIIQTIISVQEQCDLMVRTCAAADANHDYNDDKIRRLYDCDTDLIYMITYRKLQVESATCGKGEGYP